MVIQLEKVIPTALLDTSDRNIRNQLPLIVLQTGWSSTGDQMQKLDVTMLNPFEKLKGTSDFFFVLLHLLRGCYVYGLCTDYRAILQVFCFDLTFMSNKKVPSQF